MMRRIENSEGYVLYELTARDLGSLVGHDYQAGNILIYRPFEKARLGRELGRASDLKAAKAFLASCGASPAVFPLEGQPPVGQMGAREPAAREGAAGQMGAGEGAGEPVAGQIAEEGAAGQMGAGQPTAGQPVTRSIIEEQTATDDLAIDFTQALRDKDRALLELKTHYEALMAAEAQATDEATLHLSATIEALKQNLAEKDARITQLSLATLQGDLQREELMNELIEATAQSPALEAIEELDELRTHSTDVQNELKSLRAAYADLEGTNLVLLAEKSTLEIELATALRDNASLRGSGDGARAVSTLGMSTGADGEADRTGSFAQSSDSAKELVLADEAGSTIHIYHEFPTLPKRSLWHKTLTRSRYIGLALAAVLAVAYIAYLNSVLGAIQSAGIDIHSYSEAVIAHLRELLGF
jgi:hypothetical protein